MKQCPFCGSEDIKLLCDNKYIHGPVPGSGTVITIYRYACEQCNMQGPKADDFRTAHEMWNDRAAQKDLPR